MSAVPPPLAVRAVVPVALVEAASLLVLLGFVVARAAGGPDLSSTLGPLHGVVFVLYVVTVILARDEMGWSAGRTFVVLLAAVVPVGGAVVAHRVAGRG